MPDIEITDAKPGDGDAIAALLQRAQLPTDGLAAHLATACVARRGNQIVGSAALEVYTGGALLRSVAVDPACRGTGLGHRLTAHALARAAEQAVPAVYLLTTTADAYFPRFGFERIDRAEVPESVQASVEFRGACPASAIAMRKWLQPPVRATSVVW
jgi:amino-acid N-acetyltransferase